MAAFDDFVGSKQLEKDCTSGTAKVEQSKLFPQHTNLRAHKFVSEVLLNVSEVFI